MIFTMLMQKTKLKELGIANNYITDKDCDVIAKLLQVNCTLEWLSIHGNQISKDAIQCILNSLRYNNTLTQLLLPSDFSEDDKKQICDWI